MVDKWQRLQKLVDLWLEHIHETPDHTTPLTEDGEATYDTSPSAYRIYCCASGCDWQQEIDDDRPGE